LERLTQSYSGEEPILYEAELGLFALFYAELARAQGQLDWVKLVLLHA
jgi:hypothetical protein